MTLQQALAASSITTAIIEHNGLRVVVDGSMNNGSYYISYEQLSWLYKNYIAAPTWLMNRFYLVLFHIAAMKLDTDQWQAKEKEG